MRAHLVLALTVAVAGTAEANTRVVVMADPANAAALRVTLRGAQLMPLAPPEGAARGRRDRDELARRSARRRAARYLERFPHGDLAAVMRIVGR